MGVYKPTKGLANGGKQMFLSKTTMTTAQLYIMPHGIKDQYVVSDKRVSIRYQKA